MKTARAAGIAMALAGVLAASARAADDGGVQSVFAVGAGNRALALGGAYGALADDASAALWNPGGMGRVQRGEVQFSQASLTTLDFRETFAGAVLPDWRWGVASVTLRHFGTGGIEARDERNVLLDGDRSASESEVGFGYGRSLGPAWSVGGVAKFRRQDVAGRAGNGIGVDLGVRVLPGFALGRDASWLGGVAVGFALTNAIEPEIRLDRESVADPSGYRLGVAFTRPGAIGPAALLATFDLERTRGTATRAHAGLELRPHPLLALRSGLNGGTLTAGTGLRWGPAELDYVFEDAALGPNHRAGVTFRFGAAVDEARAAAAHAEDERLEVRLAELDRGRQTERLDALFARAEDERQARRYDEALGILATLRTLAPEDPRTLALEISCRREQGAVLEAAGDLSGATVAYQRALALAPGDTTLAASLERVRLESDRLATRSAEIRRQFAAALEALSADNLRAARLGFARVLAAEPNDAEARRLLTRVEEAIARQMAELLERADALTRAGAFADAEAQIARARALDPAAPGLAAATAALARQRTALGARRTPVATARATLTPEQEREVADLYRRGQSALAGGRNDEALRYWELVWSIQPGYQRVDEYLKREYLTRGMEQFAAGRLDDAIATWERALRIDPKDPRALGYLARAREQLSRTREIVGEAP